MNTSISKKYSYIPSPLWFVVGIIVGGLSCKWGESFIPAFVLKHGSGIGWIIVLAIVVLTVLSVMAHFCKSWIGKYSAADYRNFSPYVIERTKRAWSLMLGFSCVAFFCWFYIESDIALASLFLGMLLFMAFYWFWYGLKRLGTTVEKK
jgi:hypothetical protein